MGDRRASLAGAIAWLTAVLAFPLAAGAQSPNSVVTRLKQDPVLKVCYAQGTPDSYKDPKTGVWTGVMVDLVNELATQLHAKVEPVEVQWPTAVLSLKRGDCDFFGGSLVYNPGRALEVAFTRPFWAKGLNMVVPVKNPKNLQHLSDLNSENVTIAAVVGSREFESSKRLFPKAKFLAIPVNTDIQIIDPVRRGDADVAVLPTITIQWWLQVPENAAWGKMGFPGEDFGNAPNGWAVRFGDPEWRDFLDEFSNWVSVNGLAPKLYDEYLKKTNPFSR
jgi:ABC-type amino acid transport substrate-binding protein